MTQNISSNRIPEILKRLQINCQQPEAIKTCFGLLAILSREEAHKLIIAKDGLELILASMNNHIDRVDIQEAGCDLLWSLAFNSNQVKEIVVKYQGASVVVKALKKHARTGDFLKSACGALSNLCQVKANQDLIFQQGGLQPLVNAIQIHQLNTKLLPFIFDAIASVIVNQEENTKSVASLGLIQAVLTTLQRHKMAKDIVKSGCHTLAILSDVKDQASKISQQGGVGLIISLIDFHSTYSELHRVAAVVLLRMLQENSSNVGKDIVTNDGVRVLLQALDRIDVQQDTVAAITHILYTVSNPPTSTLILPGSLEKQLWQSDTESTSNNNNSLSLSNTPLQNSSNTCSSKSLLKGVVKGISNFTHRRDVVRAACRLLMNLRHYDKVYLALDDFFIVEKLLICSVAHKDAKDVLESSVLLCKHIYKLKGGKSPQLSPLFSSSSLMSSLNSSSNLSSLSSSSLVSSNKENPLVLEDNLREQIFNGLILILKNKSIVDEEFLISSLNFSSTIFIHYYNINLMNKFPNNQNFNEKILLFLNLQLQIDKVSFLQYHLQLILSIYSSFLLKKDENSSNASSNSSNSPKNSSYSSVLTTISSLLNKDYIAVGKNNLINEFNGCFYYMNLKNPIKCLIHLKEWLSCLIQLNYFNTINPTLNYTISSSSSPGSNPSIISSENMYSCLSLLCNALSEKYNFLQLKDYIYNELTKDSQKPDEIEKEVKINTIVNLDETDIVPEIKDIDNTNRNNDENIKDSSNSSSSSSTSNLTPATSSTPSNNSSNIKSTKSSNKTSKSKKSNSNSTYSNISSLNPFVSNHLPPTICYQKRHFPLHPCKEYYYANPFNNPLKKLIDNWPNFYEKLINPSLPAPITSFSEQNSILLDSQLNFDGESQQGQPPEKTILCYESNKPAGRHINPKFPTHMPYSEYTTLPSSSSSQSLPSDYNIDDNVISRSSFSSIYNNNFAYNTSSIFPNTLTFDSEFECGNLYRVLQTGETTYDLVLRSDINSLGHTQWFYFAVSNTHLKSNKSKNEKVKIKFNIINFTKPDSLFNFGMQPCIYSTKRAKELGEGWVRSGSDISYYCNYYNRGVNPVQFSSQINNNILSYNFQQIPINNAGNGPAGEGKKWYYSLTFTIEFSDPEDTTLIAYGYPYSYTDYKIHLQSILERNNIETKLRNYKLCTTLGNNDCDLLVITDYNENGDQIGPLGSATPSGSGTGSSGIATASASSSGNSSPCTVVDDAVPLPPEDNSPFTIKGKKKNLSSNSNSSSSSSSSNSSTITTNSNFNYIKPAIFFSCRVHPGEIPSSWIMKGLIDFLLSDYPSANFLRKYFIIFIVPMLNPDGVIYGNNRCSLAGVDLNRQWKTPSKQAHPTIFSLKNLLGLQKKYRDVALYIDFHGHSRKYNVFFYGCEEKKSKNSSSNSSSLPRYLTNTTSSMSNLTINSSNVSSILSNSIHLSHQSPRSLSKFVTNHFVTKKFFNYDDCAFHLKKGRDSTARIVVSKEFNIGLSFTMEATFCSIDFGNLKNNQLNIGHFLELGIGFGDSIWQFAVAESWIPYNREGFLITNPSNPPVNLSQIVFNPNMLSSLLHLSHCDGLGQIPSGSHSTSVSASPSMTLLLPSSSATSLHLPSNSMKNILEHNCLPLEPNEEQEAECEQKRRKSDNEDNNNEKQENYQEREEPPPTSRSSCYVESDSEDSDNDIEIDESYTLEKEKEKERRSSSLILSQSSNSLSKFLAINNKEDNSKQKSTKFRSFSEGTSNEISSPGNNNSIDNSINDTLKNKFFINNLNSSISTTVSSTSPVRNSFTSTTSILPPTSSSSSRSSPSRASFSSSSMVIPSSSPSPSLNTTQNEFKKQEIYRSISPYLNNRNQSLSKSITNYNKNNKNNSISSSSFNHAFDMISSPSTIPPTSSSSNVLRSSSSKEDLYRLSNNVNSLAYIGANIVSKRDFSTTIPSVPSTSTAVSSSNPCTSRVPSYKPSSFSK